MKDNTVREELIENISNYLFQKGWHGIRKHPAELRNVIADYILANYIPKSAIEQKRPLHLPKDFDKFNSQYRDGFIAGQKWVLDYNLALFLEEKSDERN